MGEWTFVAVPDADRALHLVAGRQSERGRDIFRRGDVAEFEQFNRSAPVGVQAVHQANDVAPHRGAVRRDADARAAALLANREAGGGEFIEGTLCRDA